MLRIAPWPLPPGQPFSAARNELWIPRGPLASCVRAAMSRDTCGVPLADDQRYNQLPTSPACAILWYLHGQCELLAPGLPAEAASTRCPIGRISFCGPFTQPTVSWNPGPMHAFMVLLMPDAVAAMTGVDVGALLDRIVPVEQLLPADWLDLCRAVDEAADDGQRVALVEQFLLPRWREKRPGALPASHLIADWSRNLALWAATSGLGRSLRQAERRLKRWTGQTGRDLHGLGRSERAFLRAAAAHRAGQLDWSELADRSGYADQAHLSRECRRVTGFPPEELRRRVATEEAFWAYRLWGFSEGLGLHEPGRTPALSDAA
jgi:AraC-like DNA-binding protein